MGKEGGIVPLAPHFPRIARAMLIGRDAPIFAETLTKHGVPFDMVETLEAVVPAWREAQARAHRLLGGDGAEAVMAMARRLRGDDKAGL